MSGPFVSAPMPVRPEWTDYNGHLNMAYYHVLFDTALDVVLEPLGLGPFEPDPRDARPCPAREARERGRGHVGDGERDERHGRGEGRVFRRSIN